MRLSGVAGFGLVLGCLSIATPTMAASSQFGMAYRVERASSGKLSVATCLATAKREAQAAGYTPAMENNYPGQLAVFAAGPRAGGASLVVYCIAVDQKTAYVVQGLDYSRPDSPEARRVVDRVHRGLAAVANRR